MGGGSSKAAVDESPKAEAHKKELAHEDLQNLAGDLKSESAKKAEEAACKVRVIARGNNNGIKFVAAGAIPPLVALLGSGNSTGVQEQAAWTLQNIAVNDENEKKINDSGAIPLLKSIRDNGSTQAANAAKGALFNLGI